MILVTGAAGKTGRAIAQELVSRGTAVRALVRREKQVQQMEALGVWQALVGDMGQASILAAAVAGVEAIYHICPNMHPHELTIGEHLIDAARTAGAPRIVYHSVLHPQVQEMPHHWQKMRVEELLFKSGLPFTILQPAAYMQNILANQERVRKEGIYEVPYGVETRLSMVDLADVAQAAVRVLLEPGHEAAIYELSGAERLTQVHIAELLGAHLGRPVRAQSVSLDEWEARARQAGLSDYAVQTLLAMFAYYDRFGFTGSSNVLTWLLGRPPAEFADFLQREWPS